MNRFAKIVLPILVLVVAGLASWAIVSMKSEPETQRPEFPPPVVRVATASSGNVGLVVESQGTVAPRTESRLVPEVSGRVVSIAGGFVAGGFFERGDVLFEIDPFEYRQAVTQARAQVAQAQLRLAREEAEAEVARREWKELGQGDGSPLTLREPQVEDARAALAAAEAGLERAERDLRLTSVRAPYAGRVRSKQVDVGQYVTRGTPVATIYAVDYAEVRLPLPNDDLAYLDVPLDYRGELREDRGPRVTLSATFAGRVHAWDGRIVRTEGEIDPRTRMVHVVARVRNPYGRQVEGRPPLSVGMFVDARIEGREAGGVFSLPRAALRGRDAVWVVDGEDRLRIRPVSVLRAERERVLIDGGLEDGERVCLSPLEAITDGMEVRVLDGEAAPDTGDAGDAA